MIKLSFEGWYSIGAHFWAKFVVDLIPDLISVAFFCWIITFYDEMRINSLYFIVMFMLVLYFQSIGQICAILFSSDAKLAIMLAQTILCFLLMSSNVVVPVRLLHYSIQYISEFNFLRLALETIMLVLYGFDRCSESEISVVLYGMGISEQMFSQKIIHLILICILLKLFTLLLLIFKINFYLEDNRRLADNENKLTDYSTKVSFLTL